MKPRVCGVLLALVLAAGARPAEAQCTYTVSPTSVSVASTGGAGTVAVVTGTSCSWTSVSSVSWITITRNPSAAGLASTDYAVAPNTTGVTRVGTLTVATKTITVTQAASSCSYTVSPTSIAAPAIGVQSSVSVVTGSACAWTATSNASWIQITRGAASTGLGSFDFSVAPTTVGRVGTIAVAGRTVTVTQTVVAGRPPSAPTGLRLVR